jgi:hypothetical protein
MVLSFGSFSVLLSVEAIHGFFQLYYRIGMVLSWVLSGWGDLPSDYAVLSLWKVDIFMFCHYEKRIFLSDSSR